MKNIWILTKVRMRLAVRNRAFLFFSLVMPLAFLFLYLGIFGRGNARAVPYLLAAVLALTVMGSFWGLSVQLVVFREAGILRRFRLAPVGAGAMLASSLLSNYFLTLPTIVVEYLLARSLFHMAGWGNLWGAWALVTLGTAAFAALGLIVASSTNTMQETQVLNNAIWFIFLFLSGATLPLPLLPAWVQRVAMFLPATYLVTGLQRTLLRASGPRELSEEMIALASGAIAAFLVSWNLFRWEPEEKVSARAKAWAAATLIPFLLLGAWESAYGQRRGEARSIYNAIQQPISPVGPPK